MKKSLWLTLGCSIALLVSAGSASAQNADPLGGWHILSEEYDSDNILDIVSFEWDYFMIDDKDSGFYGIVGYLVSNPRARLSDVVNVLPDGGNVAMIGQVRGAEPMAQYMNFGLDGYYADPFERTFDARDGQGRFGSIVPLPGGGPNGADALHLTGRNDVFAWDFIVSQDWADRPSPGMRAIEGTDIGYLPGETWTVDVVWPRTHVEGTVTVVSTGEIIDIDSHGYREVAWGRYIITPDGWDFYVFSEDEGDLVAQGLEPDRGVSLVLQTYHKSNLLDWTDLSFYHRGKIQSLRFSTDEGTMGWSHPNWKWDNDAWQCVPQDMNVVLDDGTYRAELKMTMGMQDQHPLLSNITLPVAVYFIQDMFPTYSGKIIYKPTGELVRRFTGKGVAEFSFHKSARLWPATTSACNLWGRSIFGHPMP